jgi:hypothetical protein
MEHVERRGLDSLSQVDLSQPRRAEAWAARFGADVETLRAVVAEVGPRPAAVATALGVPLKPKAN